MNVLEGVGVELAAGDDLQGFGERDAEVEGHRLGIGSRQKRFFAVFLDDAPRHLPDSLLFRTRAEKHRQKLLV